MSVINQMLQDLDQRRRQHPTPDPVTPLEGVKVTGAPPRRVWLIGITILLLIVTGVLVWQLLPTLNVSVPAAAVHPDTDDNGRKDTQVGTTTIDQKPQSATPLAQADATPLTRAVSKSTDEPLREPASDIKDWVIQRDRQQTRLVIEFNQATDYQLRVLTPQHVQVRFRQTRLAATPELIMDNSLLQSVHAQRQAGDVVVDIHTLAPVRSQAAMAEYTGGAGFSLSLQAIKASATDERIITKAAAPIVGTETAAVKTPAAKKLPEARQGPTPPPPTARVVKQSNPSVPSKPAQIQIQARAPSARELAAHAYQQALGASTPAQSEHYLRRSLEHDRTHQQARLALAAMLMQQGRPSEAQNYIEQGLQIHPRDHALLHLQAQWFLRQQRYVEAEQVLQQVSDGDAAHYALRASLAQRLQQPQRAAQYYEIALQMDDNQAAWWLGLAIAHEGQARSTAARHAYARALQLGGLAPTAQDYAQRRYLQLRQHTQEQ